MDGKSRVSRLAHDTGAFLFRRRPISRIGSPVAKLFFGIRAKKKTLENSPVRDERLESGEERARERRGSAGNEARVNATRGIKFGAPPPPVWRM